MRFIPALAIALLLVVTVAAMLWLVAQRHAEAQRMASDWRVAIDLSGSFQYELTRESRWTLMRMKAGAPRGRPDPAAIKERAGVLRAAGYLIDLPRLGSDGQLEHSLLIPSRKVPNLTLQSLQATAYRLTRAEDGDFLVPVGRDERRTIARLLGANEDAVGAAVRVTAADIERAAKLTLPPLQELTFHHGSSTWNAVRVALQEGGRVRVDTLDSPPDRDAQVDDAGDFVSLDHAADWPGFLLFGGREVPHYRYREEKRGADPVHVVYLRDAGNDDRPWHGISVAVSPVFYWAVPVVSPRVVLAGGVLLLAAWWLALRAVLGRRRPAASDAGGAGAVLSATPA
jgi:hypothetical protein